MFPRAFVVSAGLGLVSVLAGCFPSPSDPTSDPENVDLLVTAAVTSVVAVVVVEVTAPDIETPLAFNLDVVDGTASGTITVPAGSDRTITVTASDLEIRMKAGKIYSVQFHEQDVIGADGIQFESEVVLVTPQEFTGAGFTLHIDTDDIPVYQLSGHISGRRVAQVGFMYLADVVYQ